MRELGTAGGALNGSEAEHRARQMQLAGALFIVGALFGVPSTLILTDVGLGYMLPFTALAVVSGIVCLAAPWDRISPAWVHVALVAAVAEVATVTRVIDSSFLTYFVIIGVFVSYAFADRRVLGAYLALITLAVVAQGVIYVGEDQAAMQLAMLTIPVVLVSAVMVAYLREQQEASRLKYQRFAEEALELAARLRGQAEQEGTASPAGAQAGLPLAVPPYGLGFWDLRRAGLAVAGVALAIPLGLASLAAAGVTLPDAANDVFEQVGISLPNQSDGPGAESLAAGDPDGRQTTGGGQARDQGPPAAADQGSGAATGGSGARSQSEVAAGEGTGGGAASPAQAPSPPAPPDDGNPPAVGPVERPGPLDDALRDTLDLLDRVVPMQAPQPPPEEPPAP